MSFIGDAVDAIGDVFSGGADEAAGAAANAQVQATEKAIDFQRESRDLARKDLQPFRQAGQAQLDPLSRLISDPNAQRDFIQDNPFFDALADDAQSRLFANQAARGKVGSGGTAKALQNSLLLLGQDLLNNNINQRFNLANIGQASAAGQAAATQNTGNSISDLITGAGNARAAGIVGAANARSQGINSLIQTGFAIPGLVSLSDERAKTDIRHIGDIGGLNIYLFRYLGDDELRMGVIAQEIESVRPDAVVERDGLKFVNYQALFH